MNLTREKSYDRMKIKGRVDLILRYRNFNKFPWIILTNTQVNEKLIKGEQRSVEGEMRSMSPSSILKAQEG